MGIITIAFDDGYKDTFDQAGSYLIEKGIQATWAIPSSKIGSTLENRPTMGINDLRCLIDNGHEIASHTTGHHNMLNVYEDEGVTAAGKEFSDSKVSLEEQLGIKINSFVFPFINNNCSARLRQMASGFYSSARVTTEALALNELPVKDPFNITGVAVTTDLPIQRYNELVDEACGNNVWLIEVFHLVSDKNTRSAHRDGPYRFFTHIDDFTSHVDHVLSNNAVILTQGQTI